MKKALTTSTLALLTWVLLLIAIPTGLYVSHVFNQLAEVRENNLRTLSKAAASTNQILQTAQNNVINLLNEPMFACEFVKRQPYLEWSGNKDCSDFMDAYQPDPDTHSSNSEPVKLRGDAEGVQVLVGSNIVFDVRLDSLLAAIPFSNALDLLFIADEEGKVIHQYRPEGRQDVGLLVSSLDKLPTGITDEYTDKNSLQRASSINDVMLAGAEYQLLCQPLELDLDGKLGSQAASNQDNDGSPAEEVGNDAGASGNWVLCGLVADARSLQQSLAVAPFLAFAFFAVTVFGFLTWPAIKLLWMSNRDRLYFADLSFLLFGSMGALMLATILILGYGSHRNLVTASANSLRQLADEIEYNLQSEVDNITNALHEIDNNLKEYVGDQHFDIDNPLPDIDRLYARRPPDAHKEHEEHEEHEEREGHLEDEKHFWKDHLQPTVWPINSDFVFAFWADCNGEQFFKATIQDQNTPRVNLKRREYFQAVVRNRLWGEARLDDIPRFVEPVRSLTTGEFATVVSIRSSVPIHEHNGNSADESVNGEIRECTRIAAAQTILVSTSKPVLPPGVGFAIIDQAGTALIHSDERRALFENLYEEIDDGERLKSIVLARAEGSIYTSYLGRPHQVFVKPMEKMPWSIVTFSDTEMVSTANLEIVGHALMISFVFVLLYVLLALCYFLLLGAEVPLWFWPGAHGGKVSQWWIGVPVAGLVVLIALIASQEGIVLLAAVFCVPLLVFMGIYIINGETFERMHSARLSSNVGVSQIRLGIASSLTVWIVVAIIPAGIFFNLAIDRQSRVLIRYENEYLMDQMVGRNCAIDDYYRDVEGAELCQPGQTKQCRLKSRRDFTVGDVYRSSMFGPAPQDESGANGLPQGSGYMSGCEAISKDRESSSIWKYLADLKPIYNPTVVRSRYLQPDAQQGLANNVCWSWQPVSDAGTAKFIAGPLACGTSISATSKLSLGPKIFVDPVVLALAAILFGVLFFWTRYGVRQLFFGDLQTPPLQDRNELENALLQEPEKSKVWQIAIAASQLDRGELLNPANHDKSDDDGKSSKSHGQHNRYDMMEYMAGSSRRAALRKKLQEDIAGGKNILIVSPVDPYCLLAADEDSLGTTDESAVPEDHTHTTWIQFLHDRHEDLLLWRQILARFRVVVISINGSPPQRIWKGRWQRGLDKHVDATWLTEELNAVPELASLYPLLERELLASTQADAPEHDKFKSTRRNALERIVERAYGSYMALWDACSEDEKLVLVQLASENVVNPKQVAVVRRLIQLGLIVRDPKLRVVNQSFSRFVCEVHDPSKVKNWERTASGASWANRRWVLLGILLLGMLFLWATQRSMFNTSMLFLSAAAVGLPGIVKLMTSLNKFGSDQ